MNWVILWFSNEWHNLRPFFEFIFNQPLAGHRSFLLQSSAWISLDGYDKNGYDKKGYDKNGYDKDGYNKNGLIRKKIYQKSPRVTKYFITKKGKALLHVYMSIINFAMEHYSKEVLVDEKPKKIEDLFSKEIMKLVKWKFLFSSFPKNNFKITFSIKY